MADWGENTWGLKTYQDTGTSWLVARLPSSPALPVLLKITLKFSCSRSFHLVRIAAKANLRVPREFGNTAVEFVSCFKFQARVKI